MKKKIFFAMMVAVAVLTSCNKNEKYYFSVSNTQTVILATSNLTYNEAEGLDFAPNAYDFGDVFGWGTGDNPALDDTAAGAYAEFADWGARLSSSSLASREVTDLSSASKVVTDSWRTLTSKEWRYMVMSREKASDKYGFATVNGVQGLVLLPDNYDSAAFASMFTPGMNGYASNNYDVEKWAEMAQLGAIFLPVEGGRETADTLAVSAVKGAYWTSTGNGTTAEFFNFSENFLGVTIQPRSNRFAVRLAQDYQTKESKKDEGKDPSAPMVEEFEDGAVIVM